MEIQISDRVENIVGKGEIAHFRERGIPKFVFFVPMLELVNPTAGPVLTQGASYEQTW